MTTPPPGWQNPITANAGQNQANLDPLSLLPSRVDLVRSRLEVQRQLMLTGRRRWTPILVTSEGIVYDGHHAVRAAAEEGLTIVAQIVDQQVTPSAASIMDLPVR